MIFHARSNWSRVEKLRELLENALGSNLERGPATPAQPDAPDLDPARPRPTKSGLRPDSPDGESRPDGTSD